MAQPPTAVGVDFGTTNSAVAVHQADGSVKLARFASQRGERSTFRSILYFHREDDSVGPELARGIASFAGPHAIDRYLETVGSGRLIQSLKSYLADHSFDATNLFNRTTTLSELITFLARALRTDAVASLGEAAFAGAPVVVGRPVHFVGGDTEEDDAYAVGRLKTALVAAGFPHDVELEYEPVAAAYHYEARLDHDERILVADFGGGTSDFTLVEVGPTARAGKAARRILATDGVRLAGDSLDAKILHHVVAPALGLGSHYRSMMGKELEVPVWIYARLRKWHLLSFLRTKRTMDLIAEMESQADEPSKIEALRHVIENDLGYKLYEAVEQTKVKLSTSESTHLTFDDEPLQLDVEVKRADFERWIGEELAAIGECVDKTLTTADLGTKDVDRVFMTGGTSMVPAVRQVFASRFGEAKLAGGEELTSVASGLAHRAASMLA
jgi:hypothetical chaperone protein